MSSTGLLATETTIDKDSENTNVFVKESTPSQDNSERRKCNFIVNSTSENMITDTKTLETDNNHIICTFLYCSFFNTFIINFYSHTIIVLRLTSTSSSQP